MTKTQAIKKMLKFGEKFGKLYLVFTFEPLFFFVHARRCPLSLTANFMRIFLCFLFL